MDGLCNSAHVPGPGLAELARVIQPISLTFKTVPSLTATITNHYDFVTTAHLACVWSVYADGELVREGGLALPAIKPRSSYAVSIPYRLPKETPRQQEIFLALRFVLKNDMPWALAGHCIAAGECCLQAPSPSLPPSPPLPHPEAVPGVMQVTQTRASLRAEWRDSVWTVDLTTGHLQWQNATGVVLIDGGPTLDFYRAPTDNDKGSGDASHWRGYNLHLTRMHVRNVNWVSSKEENTTTVTIEARVAPPVQSWYVDATLVYVLRDGHMQLSVRAAAPRRVRDDEDPYDVPQTYARRGLVLALPPVYQSVAWYGLGPGETYKDRRQAGLTHTHRRSIGKTYTLYDVPQETGNHTGTRELALRRSPTPPDETASLSGSSTGWLGSDDQSTYSAASPRNSLAAAIADNESALDATSPPLKSYSFQTHGLHWRTPSAASRPLASELLPAGGSSGGDYFLLNLLDHPQHSSGSKTDEPGMKVTFLDRPGDFAMLPWTAQQLEAAGHPYELDADGTSYLRLDEDHHGLGSGSCGPGVRKEYRCKAEAFEYRLAFEMLYD